ncbi:MAG: coiled-coil domain-containing protein 22 [Candidatus Omnitrophica bacterium]|jgi:chromosome segregation ATPase|nr:coiled-coil domain-containing protein 22 [Candidatus Omnitrophota bacterium]
MNIIIIIFIAAGVIFTLYAFIASTSETKDKKRKESSIFDLKQQVISSNVKIQNLEFDNSSLRTEMEKLRSELTAAKEDLNDSRENEGAIKEDLQNMRLAEDSLKSTLDTLRAENESLKDKLMEKENENKRLLDENKDFRERMKIKPAGAPNSEIDTVKKNITDAIHNIEKKNIEDSQKNKETKIDKDTESKDSL